MINEKIDGKKMNIAVGFTAIPIVNKDGLWTDNLLIQFRYIKFKDIEAYKEGDKTKEKSFECFFNAKEDLEDFIENLKKIKDQYY